MSPMLLYDGDCELCNRSIRFINAHGGREKFNYIPLDSEQGRKILTDNNLPVDYDKSLVLVDNGKVYLYTDAVLRIMQRLDGYLKWLYWLKIFPRPLRNGMYNLVAKHRHILL